MPPVIFALIGLGIGAACFAPLLLKDIKEFWAPALAAGIAGLSMFVGGTWTRFFGAVGFTAVLAFASWVVNKHTLKGRLLLTHIGGAIIIMDLVISGLYGMGWIFYHLPEGVRYVLTGAGALLGILFIAFEALGFTSSATIMVQKGRQ